MQRNGNLEGYGSSSASGEADNIEQVRELLFGEHQRRTENQIQELTRRIAELEEKIDRMAAESRDNLKASEERTAASQKEVVLRISNAIKTLGREVEQLAAERSGD